MPVSWNLSQVENVGYTKLSECSNKEPGRCKVEAPCHLHNDRTGGKLLKKWMFIFCCSWDTSSCSSQRYFQRAWGAGPAQRNAHRAVGWCFRDTARALTEPHLRQPWQCLMLPAANELTPRSCWFRGAWAQSCLALIAGSPAQAFWRGYSELGNYLDMIKLKRSFRKIAIGNERASTGDPGSEKMSLLTIPSLINVQIHVPNWAFASSLLFKQIGRHRKGWIYEIAIRMKTCEQQKISARNLQATWFSFS